MKITRDDLAAFIPGLRAAGKKTLLHVGCGNAGPGRLPDCYKTGDWDELRLDIDPSVKPHIVSTLTDLSEIPSATMDSVWSSHSLEHLNDFEVPQALSEFRRVLKPGGFALITVPDLQAVAKLIASGKSDDIAYVSPAGPITAIDMLFGHRASQQRGNMYMAHRTGFTADRIQAALQKANFAEVRVLKGYAWDLWAVAITDHCPKPLSATDNDTDVERDAFRSRGIGALSALSDKPVKAPPVAVRNEPHVALGTPPLVATATTLPPQTPTPPLACGPNQPKSDDASSRPAADEGMAVIEAEKQIASPLDFDSQYYTANNPDVVAAGRDPEDHYFASGENEGRRPNPFFDPTFYFRANSDVRKAGVSAFRHFREFGFHEGRLGESPIAKPTRSGARKPILFVGHDGIHAGAEVVLLEIIKWFSTNTNRIIKTLLLAPGILSNEYAKYAEIYVLPENSVDEPEVLRDFLGGNFEFVYLNTVVSGRAINLLREYSSSDSKVISHIHEMEKVLNIFKDEMHLLLGQVDLWISASPATTSALVRNYSIPLTKISTIPAFIPLLDSENSSRDCQKRMARIELGISESAQVVAGCGTVYWRKGPDIFVSTARKVLRSAEEACVFIWFGDGPEYEQIVQSLSDEERRSIRFLGRHAEANRLLAAADIFFLSSREDPFPLVVLESAQHGIPTICFGEATGITEFIQDDAGISLPHLDATEAALAITALLQDHQRRSALGAAAKIRVISEFSSEKKLVALYDALRRHDCYRPSVSVIAPFFNHEKYAEQRMLSILNQTIKDIEIIALDDASTDDTLKVINDFCSDPRVSVHHNPINSGSPFKQWSKGIKLSKGELIWIAEGDDFCDLNFLESLLPFFEDSLVNIASATTQVVNDLGEIVADALRPYLENAYPGKFDSEYIRDGFREVNEQLGAVCTLVNASGLIIRKSSFGNSLDLASSFKMVGDWLIYLDCLRSGKIAHSTVTRNYFRRHAGSQVNRIEGSDTYFRERYEVSQYVFRNYSVENTLIRKTFGAISEEWQRFKHKHEKHVALDDFYPRQKLLAEANVITHSPHVAFYVHGMLFSKGGIERLASQLANALSSEGWKLTIYCREWSDPKPIYPLYEAVTIKPIFNEHFIEKSVDKLRTDLLASKVDVFVPMLSERLFEPIVGAAQHTGIPIVASEHNDPTKIEELWWSRAGRIECFRRVDAVHLLLQTFKDSVPPDLHHKVTIIPNGVRAPTDLSDQGEERLIVGVGRLESQKRFDRLIEAAAIAQKTLRRTGYRVEIYGEGSLRGELAAQIHRHGIADLVSLKGLTDNISEVYSQASLLVLPSEFEGFGLAVVEAMSFGVPCIAFSNCNGPNEIIRDGVEGWLVKSTRELADRMVELTRLPDRTEFRKRAQARADDYSEERFLSQWKQLLLKQIQQYQMPSKLLTPA